MNITLLNTKVNTLVLSPESPNEDKFHFSFSSAFAEENKRTFLIVFNLMVMTEDHYSLSLNYLAQFESDCDIETQDRDAPFLKINAPAIAYPFLRASVANILLNSGHEPLLLPTINFIELSKQQDQALQAASTHTNEQDST
jgi:preprotein translocase subunit SecB